MSEIIVRTKERTVGDGSSVRETLQRLCEGIIGSVEMTSCPDGPKGFEVFLEPFFFWGGGFTCLVTKFPE